ncbi:MAG: 4-hydroxy-3-methylbut-2-enyl diphosphate reductase [Spirochaetota bacterium]|nr:4-hydroxy-3-methylbut-2-enyl diphosphate reductase [Spirochaetota bacterium]
MKIIVAKDIGYCYGVKDAIDDVVEASKVLNDVVHTYGPLIHNPKAVQELKDNYNILSITELSELKGNTLAIRAHGIPPKVLESFIDQGVNVIDATCPFVRKTQNIARQLMEDGYFVIILGKRKHPEVVGIAGHVEGHCLIVEKEEDLNSLTRKKKIGIVFQSTITMDDAAHLIPKIIDQAKEIKIHKTICGVTIKRQQEAKNIANQVDFMIVIGGKNSSNTTKLAQICEKEGVKTVQVESPLEIKDLDFTNVASVGVTTGTSTPKNAIDEILEEINKKSTQIVITSC